MADDELRESERVWRAAPDAASAERLVAAARRAGQPAPEAALDARVQPARTLRLLTPTRVLAPRPGAWPDEPLRVVGRTGRGREVELPEHPWFLVEAQDELTSTDLAALLDECTSERVERLCVRLDPGSAPATVRRLAGAGLTHLDLGGLPALDPARQTALSSPALVGLRLQGQLGGAPLDALVEAAPGLERLELETGEVVFSDPHLAPLGGLARLRRLSVHQSSWHSPQGGQGEFLGGSFPALEELVVHGPELRRTALDHVARLRLRALEAWLDEAHEPSDLELLRGLPLERLRLDGPSKTPEYAELLGTLRLTHLELDHDSPPAFCERLPAGLTSLELMTSGTPTWLERLHGLRRLSLTLLRGTLEPLAHLSALEELRLSGEARTTSPSLEPLEGLARLEALTLSLPTWPEGLAPLWRLPRLVRLGLGGWNWTDAHLELLARLPHLEELNLSGGRLGNRTLGALVGCRSLRRLRVPGACDQITDGSLRAFSAARPEVLLLDRDGR